MLFWLNWFQLRTRQRTKKIIFIDFKKEKPTSANCALVGSSLQRRLRRGNRNNFRATSRPAHPEPLVRFEAQKTPNQE